MSSKGSRQNPSPSRGEGIALPTKRTSQANSNASRRKTLVDDLVFDSKKTRDDFDRINTHPVRSFSKYLLLLYKIFKVALHNKIATFVQIVFPWLFAFLPVMFITRQFSDPYVELERIKNTPGRSLPSSIKPPIFHARWPEGVDLYLLMGFLFLALSVPREINQEKQKRMKEYMKMVGVSNFLQWLSWFTKFIILFASGAFWVSYMFNLPGQPKWLQITRDTDFSVWFLLFMLWGLAQISFGFFVSALFTQASMASACAAVVYIVSYIPFIALLPYNINNVTLAEEGYKRLYLSLIPNSALPIALKNLRYAEEIGWDSETSSGTKGYKINDLFRKPEFISYQYTGHNGPVLIDQQVEISVSIGNICVCQVIWTCVFAFLAWYVESVFPGEYGVPEKPWFFLTPGYWCGATWDTGDAENRAKGYKSVFSSNPYNEADPKNLRAGINIAGLTKKFGAKAAVDNLYLKMFEGQITAFLGHNGAGKTTTMSMLTGFIPPTTGTAIINGFDLSKSLSEIRANIGLCPQHDILFDSMTVQEHMYFFGTLKGCPSSLLKRDIEYYMKAADLKEKRHKLTTTLSGGQKRKLSVCIALIAKSKIVILDEPTSGMDPSVRRQIWDILQAQRAGRTILLSTHFMDEADHLGDRIAIIYDGELQACGSSHFLKRTFTPGYTLSMNIDQEKVKMSDIDDLVRAHVPSADFQGRSGAEVTYYLPTATVSKFPTLFNELEDKQPKLGVLGFGASVATQEKVFQRVGELKAKRDGETVTDDKATFKRPYTGKLLKNSGCDLQWQQFKAMIIKRVISSRRKIGLGIFQISMPILFSILAGVAVHSTKKNSVVNITEPEHVLGAVERFELAGLVFQNIFTFGYAFLVSTFILFVVQERVSKAKHSQIASGTSWYIFWLGHCCVDMLTYIVPLTGAIIALAVVGAPYISDSGFLSALFVFLLLFGFAILSQTYLLHYLASQQASAFVAICVYNIMTLNVLVGLRLFFVDPSKDRLIVLSQEAMFDTICALFTPNYAMSAGLKSLVIVTALKNMCDVQAASALSEYVKKSDKDFGGYTSASQYCGTDNANNYKELNHIREALELCCYVPNLCGSLEGYDLGSFDPEYIKNCDTGRDFNNQFDEWNEGYYSLTKPGLGSYFLTFICQAGVCWLIIILIETSVIIRCCYGCRRKTVRSRDAEAGREDSDVVKEKKLILKHKHAMIDESPVVIDGLSKNFGTFKAVDNLYLEIDRNQCFGLLGVNGAGKTTTFRMLTGDEWISGGNAYMNGYSIRSQLNNVQSQIGYCPQHDALIDHMTGDELLWMFSRIRGIEESQIPTVVTYLIEALALTKHRHKPTHAYSGGNKRKLSTAIALVGDPAVVFLDEPTTGMDPVARRRLWDVVTRYRQDGNTIILTSHSMEECEALCTRMGIMVNGKFRCLGTTQHLKTKFGAGYTIIVRLINGMKAGGQGDAAKSLAAAMTSLKNFIEKELPGSKVVDEHQNVVQYHIPKSNVGVGGLFKILEEGKGKYKIEDYSVSQTSIEQVFLNFAREQREDREDTQATCAQKYLYCSCCVCMFPEYISREDV